MEIASRIAHWNVHCLLTAAVLSAFQPKSPSQYCRIERVSVSSSGAQANDECLLPSLSLDGSVVSYASGATNLVPGDTNGTYDVFVFDRTSRTTERVSISSSGAEANSSSGNSQLSADGRFVVFDSGANNLDPLDANSGADIYLRDRREVTTVLISRRLDSYSSPFGCQRPAMSSDARYIAFLGFDDNVVQGDNNGQTDVFLHDRELGTMELISLSDSGVAANDDSLDCVVSDDGRYVAFQCRATNWEPIGPNPIPYVYRRDRFAGRTELVNMKPDGSPSAYAVSQGLDISTDGRYVAFCSFGLDVTGHGTSGYSTIFLRDMLKRASTPVALSPTHGRGDSQAEEPALSDDGRKITFLSAASNLVPLDEDFSPGANQDIFLRDMHAGTTVVISVGDHGQPPNNGGMGRTAISGDGRVVAFETNANNLVPGDTGLIGDIYVVECDNYPVLHYCESMPNSLGCFPSIDVVGEPSILDEQPFWIRAENVLSGSEGFFLYGVAGASGVPVMGGGWLCIQSPFQRMRLQATQGGPPYHQCNGFLEVDFDAWIRSGIDPALAVGTTVYVQAWSKDPVITQGKSLTDAITFQVAP